MGKFEVLLTKSYILQVEANTAEQAKKYAELLTGDIQNIATKEEEKKYNFKILEIECTLNEATSVEKK